MDYNTRIVDDIFDPSTILVQWDESSDEQSVRALIKALVPFCGVSGVTPTIRLLTVRVPEGYSPHLIAEALSKNKIVASARVNQAVKKFATLPMPTDPDLYVNQTVHDAIHLREAWGITQGSPDVNIVIIDSGFTLAHPDVSNNIGGMVTFRDGTGADLVTPMHDTVGHGTATSGIATAIANNDTGLAGVAHGCTLWGLKISGGPADTLLFTVDIIDALMYAADNIRGVTGKPTVISMSFGGGEFEPAENAAIQYARQAGCVLVAAAGNGSLDLYDPENEEDSIGSYEFTYIWVIDGILESAVGKKAYGWNTSRGTWWSLGHVQKVEYIGDKTHVWLPQPPDKFITFTNASDLLTLDSNDYGSTPSEVDGHIHAFGVDFTIETYSSTEGWQYPGSYENVICVAATGGGAYRPAPGQVMEYGWKAKFSNVSEHVDVAAPGVNIWCPIPMVGIDWFMTDRLGNLRSNDPSDPYSLVNGTSFSTPITAGVVALMLSHDPALDPDQVEQILKATATSGLLNWQGTGLQWGMGAGQINAYAALGGESVPAVHPRRIKGGHIHGGVIKTRY